MADAGGLAHPFPRLAFFRREPWLWPPGPIDWLLDRLALVPTLEEAQHLTLFSRDSLATAMQAAGWRVEEIGSFNGLAPFVTPLSAGLAHAVERLEHRWRRGMPWNLLYCRARADDRTPAWKAQPPL